MDVCPTTLHDLDQDALMQILTKPKNALTRQYTALFDMEGVALEFDEPARQQIAKKAMERKSGARGLRAILENILLDTMYELPSMKHVEKVVVDEDVVNNKKKPEYIFKPEEGKKSKAIGE